MFDEGFDGKEFGREIVTAVRGYVDGALMRALQSRDEQIADLIARVRELGTLQKASNVEYMIDGAREASWKTVRPWETVAALKRQSESLAAAARELIQKDVRRGGDGKLRDTAAILGDECETILLFTNWQDDACTLYAEFRLSLPMAEKDFDSRFYAELLTDESWAAT